MIGSVWETETGAFVRLDVLAVGAWEGAGAVAVDRALAEEVDAAGDEVGAAAGVDVEPRGVDLRGAADEERRRGPPATAPTPTAASVQRKLQRRAARTASPASRATKLDCEKVGDQPDPEDRDQRRQQQPASRRSFAHSSAAIATTITSAR